MSASLLTASPVWTAVGWTMLHMIWVGAAVGLMAALIRRLLKAAHSETRYSVSLICLLALSFSPMVILVQIYEPKPVTQIAIIHPSGDKPGNMKPFTILDRPSRGPAAYGGMALGQPEDSPKKMRLELVVPWLPWLWLCGSVLTLTMLATGLIGVKQLRQSSRLVETGDLPRRCRVLADSFGVAHRVSVGICDRLAVPVLIGILRPVILLPPIALGGWSVEQIEMVLLHELAHLRRRDNLVNLLQRFVESLLFFHPVVWWLSTWVRLERELCCDRLVVERLGQPEAYAEMLVAFSGTSGRKHRAVMAMADRHVLTRIRRLLNLEERSMELTLPEGLGLLGAVFVGVMVVFVSHRAETRPANELQRTTVSVAGTAVDDRKDTPEIKATPLVDLLSSKDGPPAPRPPINPRVISLFRQDTRRLQIVQYPTSPDGVTTYRCSGGIEILCESSKFGTVFMKADEALIKRTKLPRNEEKMMGPRRETWFENGDLPMSVHLKGNAIIRQDGHNVLDKDDTRIVRASELEYDFVTRRLVVTSADPGPVASRSKTPTRQVASQTSREPTVPGIDERIISLAPRDAPRIKITDLPRELDGTIKYVCKGGIRIVIKTAACGVVSIEADEAVVARKCRFGPGQTISETSGGTWIEDEEVPMEIHGTHNVILSRSWDKAPGEIARWAVHADRLDYNVVTGHLSAKNVRIDQPGIQITAAGIEVETLAPQPVGSLLLTDPLNTPARDRPGPTGGLPSAPSPITGEKDAPHQSARP